MEKLTLQFGVFCLLFWSCIALKYTGECKINRNESINGIKIDLDSKFFLCTGMFYENIPQKLKPYLKRDDIGINSINLQLHHILFDRMFGQRVMRVGWLNMKNVYIERLHLHDTEISKIVNNAFGGHVFSRLKYLYMINVPIKSLKKGTFNGLKALKELHLSRLKLINLSDNVLQSMPNLEIIDIDNSGKIELDALFGRFILHNLRGILIQNCNINDSITENTFNASGNVMLLNLNSNHIDTIGPQSFRYTLPSLGRLYLRGNHLKSIPADLFETNNNIFIDVTLNPWHCDCKMENFRLFAQTTTSVEFKGFICNTPREYNGMELKDCPPLCKKETQIEVNKANRTFNLEYDDMKSLQLTKPTHKINPVLKTKKEELYINTELLSNNFKLIEFEQNTCTSYFKFNEMENIKFKRKLEPNILYRFCWMEIDSKMVFPLDCVTLHSSLNEEELTDLEIDKEDFEPWIMMESKTIVITVCVLVASFAPVFGILISIALAKLFSKKIRGLKPNSEKKSATNSREKRNHRSKASDRCHRRRRCRAENVIESNRSMKQIVDISPLYENFMSMYFSDVPPPLPPRNRAYARNKAVNMRNDVINIKAIDCCDSGHCECYYEL